MNVIYLLILLSIIAIIWSKNTFIFLRKGMSLWTNNNTSNWGLYFPKWPWIPVTILWSGIAMVNICLGSDKNYYQALKEMTNAVVLVKISD